MAGLVSLLTTNLMGGIDAISDRVLRHIAPPTRGRVLIVPALPGSELGRPAGGRADVVWFDVESIRQGRLVELAADATGAPLAPVGVAEPAYLQMILRLRLAGYDVATHPYDWRRSVRALGEELAARIRDEGREVHLVAHSFGGLVARAALLSGAPRVGKVIMVGTPHHGSFEVIQGLRGTHWVMHLLGAIDGKYTAQQLAERVFATWPSIYEALPDRRAPGALDVFDPGAWPRSGIAPHDDLLSAAVESRAWLDQPIPPPSARNPPTLYSIAGYGLPTCQRAEVRDDVFHYHRSDAGDGLVATDRATLEGHPRYYARCAHIGMANHDDVIAAVEDILETGRTGRLPTAPPAASVAAMLREDEVVEPPFDGLRGDQLDLSDLRDGFNELAGFFAPGPVV